MAKKTAVKKTDAPIKRPVSRTRAKKAASPLNQDVQAAELVVLDFPEAAETITSPSYTLRFSAPERTTAVEVSIDDEAWNPARFAVGHWWYDWSDYLPGSHRVRARAFSPEGESLLERPCVVLF